MKKIIDYFKEYSPSILMGIIVTSIGMIVTALCTHSFYGRVLIPLVVDFVAIAFNECWCKFKLKMPIDINRIAMGILGGILIILFLIPISYIK